MAAGSFWRGFATGAGTAVLAVGVLVAGWARHGITVTVPASAVGPQVEAAVRQHVAAALPGALAQVREALPGTVAAAVAGRLAGGRLDLGVVDIEIPGAMRDPLAARLTELLTQAGDHLLAQVQVDAVAARAGREARRLVEERLAGQPAVLRLELRPVPWLSLPVAVRVH